MPVCGWLAVFDVQRMALPKLIIKSQPEFPWNPRLFSIRKILFHAIGVFFPVCFIFRLCKDFINYLDCFWHFRFVITFTKFFGILYLLFFQHVFTFIWHFSIESCFSTAAAAAANIIIIDNMQIDVKAEPWAKLLFSCCFFHQYLRRTSLSWSVYEIHVKRQAVDVHEIGYIDANGFSRHGELENENENENENESPFEIMSPFVIQM